MFDWPSAFELRPNLSGDRFWWAGNFILAGNLMRYCSREWSSSTQELSGCLDRALNRQAISSRCWHSRIDGKLMSRDACDNVPGFWGAFHFLCCRSFLGNSPLKSCFSSCLKKMIEVLKIHSSGTAIIVWENDRTTDKIDPDKWFTDICRFMRDWCFVNLLNISFQLPPTGTEFNSCSVSQPHRQAWMQTKLGHEELRKRTASNHSACRTHRRLSLEKFCWNPFIYRKGDCVQGNHNRVNLIADVNAIEGMSWILELCSFQQ
jgi:hypothetical protein